MKRRTGTGPSASTQVRLARVQALRELETGPELFDALRRALGDASEHVVARAAEIAGDRELRELEDALIAEFERLAPHGAERDKGCVAKAAVVEALVRIGSDASDLYLRAVRIVQTEPVFGGRVDTAAGMRGAACMGLVRSAHPRAYEHLAELLADPEVQARVGAAEAAEHGAPHVVVPLLRLRAVAGDPEPRVVGACFAALLDVAPQESLGFVARFLDGAADEVQEAAALALGESRLPEALPILTAWHARAPFRDAERVALLAISLLRSEEAFAHLLGVVRDAPTGTARHALAALAPHCERETLRERALAAARGRKDRALEREAAALLAGT